MSGCTIEMFDQKLMLVNPMNGGHFGMVLKETIPHHIELTLKAHKTLNHKLLEYKVDVKVMDAVLFNRIWVKILKASSRQASSWAKSVRLHLFIDRSIPEPSRVMDASLEVLAAREDRNDAPMPLDYSKGWLFQAMKSNGLSKPVGFFLTNGSVLEAELRSEKKMHGSVTLEIAYSLATYTLAS